MRGIMNRYLGVALAASCCFSVLAENVKVKAKGIIYQQLGFRLHSVVNSSISATLEYSNPRIRSRCL